MTDLPHNNLVFDEGTSQTKVSVTLSLHLTPRGALRGSTVTCKEDMGRDGPGYCNATLEGGGGQKAGE